MVEISVFFTDELLPGNFGQQVFYNFRIELGRRVQFEKFLLVPVEDYEEYIEVTEQRQLYGLFEERPLSLAVSGHPLFVVRNVFNIVYSSLLGGRHYCKSTFV